MITIRCLKKFQKGLLWGQILSSNLSLMHAALTMYQLAISHGIFSTFHIWGSIKTIIVTYK